MDNLYLLANPSFLKKKQKKNDDINDLFLLLKKIFQVNINYYNNKNQLIILSKIENLLIDFQIENYTDNLINNIINDVIEEFDN